MLLTNKITVQVICYNQQDLIARCLDSLICQKEFIKEILVFDDCSTDNTVKILKDYQLRYPDLIRVLHSERNLGIFANIERRWEFRTEGLVYDLAGDDEVPKGWFESVCTAIKIYNIDVSEAVAIYGDYLVDYGHNKKLKLRNSHVRRYKDLWRLYQRGYITNRAVCYSSSIKLKYRSCLEGRSYVSENVQDSQLHLNVNQAYYIPEVGNIYHAGIGVSASMTGEKWRQHLNTMLYSFKWYRNEGYSVKRQDVFLPYRNRSWKKFLKYRSLKKMLVWSFYATLTLDFALGINVNKLRILQSKVIELLNLQKS